ncbi:hypothetical protein N7462_002812 [Penicillium macrosclerotiorum]|uniref:uncharacterized protein n=1 Tax=Penicillium macrosclerotiorum TaxID=303699 RepID=UPI0025470C51|nr:uncharacterized protein N7462_002812 [Penicillium macrosclerotiorum]KAJ5693389.1 hypothetical protein N7462_002812 [Penicillium macrosclerotiorum]
MSIPIPSAGLPSPRLLFIASIGNPKPYLTTRHSAGHILLDAVSPLLHARLAPPSPPPPFSQYTTYRSPSLMNISGPKLVKALRKWLAQTPPLTPTTLVLLHDELEATLGRVRVKRGGPEAASLRGHRGLRSVFDSLHGAGLWPSRAREFQVLRIGVGIGRPTGREKGAVADYVLTEMEPGELAAVRGAAAQVMDVLEGELLGKSEGGLEGRRVSTTSRRNVSGRGGSSPVEGA